MNLKNYSDGFFEVNSKNGFLPIKNPITKLPERYSEIQSLIDDLPIKKNDGSNGLLSKKNGIEERVKSLSNLKDIVRKEKDIFINQALFRTYSFLTSAYLLAPAHFNFIEKKKYGKAYK